MQGLRIFGANGQAPSADEIDAAHRVANTHKEMSFGTIRQTDRVSGVTVEYHAQKRLAMTSPGGDFDFIRLKLTNPIPYRGVAVSCKHGRYIYRAVGSGTPAVLKEDTHFKPVRYLMELVDGTLELAIGDDGGFVVSDQNDDIMNYSPLIFNQQGDLTIVDNGQVYLIRYAPVEPIEITNFPDNVSAETNRSLLMAADNESGIGEVTRVLVSDGTLLASEAIISTSDIDGANVFTDYEYLPILNTDPNAHHFGASDFGAWWWPQTNGTLIGMARVIESFWDGSGSVPMYSVNAGYTKTLNHFLSFGVPADCSDRDDQSLDPFFNAYDIDNYRTISRGYRLSETFSRNQQWRKESSAAFLVSLKTGGLPSDWEIAVESAAPRTNVGLRKVARVDYVDELISDTTDGLTRHGERVTKRTAYLSYTTDGSIKVQVEGTLTETLVKHTDPTRQFGSQVNVPFLPLPLTIGEAYSQVNTYQSFYADLADHGEGRFAFWSGSKTVEGFHRTVHYGDSRHGTPGKYHEIESFSPPIAPYIDTLVGVKAQTVLEEQQSLADDFPNSNSDFLVLGEINHGTTITIIPVSVAKNDVDLGVFWGLLDIQNEDASYSIDSLVVYGAAQFHYDYSNASLVFDKWMPLVDIDDNGQENEVESRNVHISGYDTLDEFQTLAEFNCIVKYGKLVWPDVVKRGREHVKNIMLGEASDPAIEHPATAALMKSVIEALAPRQT